MKNSKVKQADYEIYDSGEGMYVLHYPAGVLGEEGAAIIVSKDVLDHASENSVSLRELYDLFDLNESRVLHRIGKKVVSNDRDNAIANAADKNKYHGKGYYVSKEFLGYYLNYQLARHGGGTGRFRINKTIFEYAKTNGVTTKDIFSKFNLHHLDVEKNYHFD